MYKAWFPGGESDPQIAVVRVDVTEANYWEASGELIVLLKYAAASLCFRHSLTYWRFA